MLSVTIIRYSTSAVESLAALVVVILLLICPTMGQCEELLLRQKNPHTWETISDGARGSIDFNRTTGMYRFLGNGLKKETEYALVRCAEQIPSGHILARETTDASGHLLFSGSWHNWNGKFWLVLGTDAVGDAGDSNNVGLDCLKSWHPDDYLFEDRVI